MTMYYWTGTPHSGEPILYKLLFISKFKLMLKNGALIREIFQCVWNMRRYLICYYTSEKKNFFFKCPFTNIMIYNVCACVLNMVEKLSLLPFKTMILWQLMHKNIINGCMWWSSTCIISLLWANWNVNILLWSNGTSLYIIGGCPKFKSVIFCKNTWLGCQLWALASHSLFWNELFWAQLFSFMGRRARLQDREGPLLFSRTRKMET